MKSKPRIVSMTIEMPDDNGTLVAITRLAHGTPNAVDVSVEGVISPLSDDHRTAAYKMFEAAEKAITKV